MHATDPSAPEILHDANAGRFHTTVDGVEAELEYRRDGRVMTILHTGVPASVGGRGIAAALVRAALAYARAESLQVNPACAYAEAWMRKHPEYDDLRAPA